MTQREIQEEINKNRAEITFHPERTYETLEGAFKRVETKVRNSLKEPQPDVRPKLVEAKV
jgi:hypothetical protein